MQKQTTEDRAAERLMTQVRNEARGKFGVEPPTEDQVALVLHALADFTAINSALSYSPDPTEPGPHEGRAISMGRWLHAVGRALDLRRG